MVIGDREVETQTVAVRTREGADLGSMPVAQFAELLTQAVSAWSPRIGVMTIKREMRNDKRAVPKALINENISAREVRLIGADGEQVGIVSIDEALRIADEAKLDLVEISADAVPPVCKVMDYGKHLFEKKKQANEAKKNQKQIQIKEIKFRPGTEDGDYQVKLRNLVRFLTDGDKAKISEIPWS